LLVEDDLLLAAAIAGGAIRLQPGLATPAIIFSISSVLIAFFPQYASGIFVVTTLFGVLALAGLSFLYERRASAAETRTLPPST
jgi:nitrate reductase gamma subunit